MAEYQRSYKSCTGGQPSWRQVHHRQFPFFFASHVARSPHPPGVFFELEEFSKTKPDTWKFHKHTSTLQKKGMFHIFRKSFFSKKTWVKSKKRIKNQRKSLDFNIPWRFFHGIRDLGRVLKLQGFTPGPDAQDLRPDLGPMSLGRVLGDGRWQQTALVRHWVLVFQEVFFQEKTKSPLFMQYLKMQEKEITTKSALCMQCLEMKPYFVICIRLT